MNVVIFGAPGSGKGTQSEKLIKKYGLHHISTGEVLRDHIARKTPIGQIANTYIKQGQLIPDSLMIRILEEILDNEPKAKDGVILDGFPRTVPQADALKRFFERRGQKLHHVIGLEVPEEELMVRMIRRGEQTGRADRIRSCHEVAVLTTARRVEPDADLSAVEPGADLSSVKGVAINSQLLIK